MFNLRGKTIERNGSRFINKHVEVTSFESPIYYAFEEEGRRLKSLGATSFLEDARLLIGKVIQHPVKETKSKKSYPQFTGTSRKS